MRCPECSTRNSVAALKCEQCGQRFKRKPLPVALIGGAVAVVAVLVMVLAAIAIVPAMLNPEAQLQKVAKRVAAGPKNAQDAERIRADLEDAVKRYLERNSDQTTKEIGDKLRTLFPSSAYEISCFDLPHKLKLVEIDTVLQPSNYLISGKTVTVLRGFEVFDDAKAFDDQAGPVLAILGHRNAQAGRQPQLRVFALLPDAVKERPADTVPKFSGEGNATFAANGKDIDVELSVLSRAAEEELFTLPSLASNGIQDEYVKAKLTYKQGKYEFTDNNGKGALAALRAVAFTISDPREKTRFAAYLSPGVQNSINSIGKLKTVPPNFTLRKLGAANLKASSTLKDTPAAETTRSYYTYRRYGRRSRRHRHRQEESKQGQENHANDSGSSRSGRRSSRNSPNAVSGSATKYSMANSDDAFEVTVAQSGGRYQVVSLSRVKVTGAALATDGSGNSTAQGSGNEPGKVVSYEDRTSNLVDKLLSSPDPVLPSQDKPKLTAALPATMPVNDAAYKGGPSTTSDNDEPKVVEKRIAGESGSVDSTSPTVKVRRGPSTGYRTITEIPKGASLEVIGKQDGWYKVRVNGKEGFVYGAFVNCKTADAYTTATVRSGKSIKDSNNRTVSRAHTGDKLVIIGGGSGAGNDDRYKVQLSDGRVGFLDKDALDVAGEAPRAVKASSNNGTNSGEPSHNDAPQFVP